MNNKFDEEVLAAYALGELDQSRLKDVEEHIQSDEAARKTVEQYQEIARLSKEALAQAEDLAMDEFRRASVMRQARKAPKMRVWRVVGVVAAAACVLLAVTVGLSGTRAREFARRAPAGAAKGIGTAPMPAVDSYGGGMGGMSGGMGGMGGGMVAGRKAAGVQKYDVNGDGAKLSFGVDYEPQQAPVAVQADSGPSPAAAPVPSMPDRYLLKMAQLTIETRDARTAAEDLRTRAIALGGYVASLDETTDGLGRHMVNIQVRVPADKLDETINSLKGFGKILQKQVNAQDVTEEYVDNESRIRNLKATEERLLDHLSKTSMIENTLKVEVELTRIREQLELIEGRHRVLKNRVEFSSINVTFSEVPKAEPIVPAQTFSVGKVSTEAVRSLVEFGRVQLAKAIWIGVWSPVWLPFVLVAWLIYRRVRRSWMA